jgi:NAD(P)-dependent dehydrogenase (short-subunit alcohol dehydrogenase family)
LRRGPPRRHGKNSIQGSVALVTGANRGIGRALVGALLEAGAAKVYAAARKIETLDRLLDNKRVVPVSLDVTDEKAIAALATGAGDVTLLLNNAGVLDFGPVLEAPLAAFERNFATNFYGVLATSRAFAQRRRSFRPPAPRRKWRARRCSCVGFPNLSGVRLPRCQSAWRSEGVPSRLRTRDHEAARW